MFGFDDHLDLAKAWGDLAVDCMTAAAQASMAMLAPFAQNRSVFSPPLRTAESQSSVTRVNGWSSGAIEPRPKSWYREPARSPFEPWLGLAWATSPANPTAAFAPQQGMLSLLKPFQAWMLSLDSAPTIPAMPITWTGWPSSASLPVTTLPWMIGLVFAMVTPSPGRSRTGEGTQFAAYRSDSGHAVAQITFPNDVVAAVAVPPSGVSLYEAFFPWLRIYD